MSHAEFDLYDLKVEVIEGDKPFVCSHKPGDNFEVQGENLIFHAEQRFSLFALAALLPLLPAKQRPLNPHDWMATDHIIACPDPHCGAKFQSSVGGLQTDLDKESTFVPPVEKYLQKVADKL